MCKNRIFYIDKLQETEHRERERTTRNKTQREREQKHISKN